MFSKILFWSIVPLIVIIGVALFRILPINEPFTYFKESRKRLPLSAEVKEKSEAVLEKPSLPVPADPLVHLVAVGDMMLSRNVGQKMVEYNDYQYPFRKMGQFLQNADITFGNLESPLLAGEPVYTPSMVFRADPECAGALTKVGFDVLSLANNHIMNQGDKGLKKTLELLEQEGIQGIGAGLSREKAHQAAIVERNNLKIAFLAYTYAGNTEAKENNAGAAIMNAEDLKSDLARAKKEADLVIVSMHAGTEYKRAPNERQIAFARQAIDAGADLVIGHHPHWFQTVEKYKGKYIIYSLGNFVFDQMWSEETREGMVADIYLDRDGVVELNFLPVKIFDYSQPQFVSPSEQNRLLKMLGIALDEQPSFSFQNGAYQEGISLGLKSGAVFAGIPSLLNQDLDQDTKEEKITLDQGLVKVFQNETKIWESDPAWVVNDYTVGDFNGDAKPDLALALWKKGDYAENSPLANTENKEHWGSHLFLYNLKRATPASPEARDGGQGALDLIWGSSILDKPLLEIEAGDFNKDQKSELVALEGAYEHPESKTSQNLNVLSWNGWGFTKDWGKGGGYYNLRVYSVPEVTILVNQAD
ncbi:MAG: CapA family protein [Patescibacteria group bacterium]|nr:CapA family protein [Patescibacteria group bacterium]